MEKEGRGGEVRGGERSEEREGEERYLWAWGAVNLVQYTPTKSEGID